LKYLPYRKEKTMVRDVVEMKYAKLAANLWHFLYGESILFIADANCSPLLPLE
jgi:hypothetical protein